MRIVNKYTKKVISRNVRYINNFLRKMIDILSKDEPEKDDAIIIAPCKNVNSFFAKNPIDVVFVDTNNTVCYIQESLMPWSRTAHVRKARFAIEMAAGKIREKNIMVNSKLQIFEE